MSTRKKHDWAQIKIKFLLSEIDEVKPFLIEKGILKKGQKMSNNTATQTKGWAKEKEQLKQVMINRAMEASFTKIEPMMEQLVMKLFNAKNLIINSLLLDVSNHLTTENKLNIKDRLEILKAIKTELDEPSRISPSAKQQPNEDINLILDNTSEKPVDCFYFDKKVYGENFFDKIEPMIIDGRTMQ